MFAWIGIALMLTGGRDFKDFSAKDWGIFKGFIAVELLTVGLTFYFANRAGKMNAALGGVPPQPKLDSIEKKQRRVMTALFILGAAISYSAELFGILRLRQAEETWRPMLLCMGLLFASAKPHSCKPVFARPFPQTGAGGRQLPVREKSRCGRNAGGKAEPFKAPSRMRWNLCRDSVSYRSRGELFRRGITQNRACNLALVAVRLLCRRCHGTVSACDLG